MYVREREGEDIPERDGFNADAARTAREVGEADIPGLLVMLSA